MSATNLSLDGPVVLRESRGRVLTSLAVWTAISALLMYYLYSTSDVRPWVLPAVAAAIALILLPLLYSLMFPATLVVDETGIRINGLRRRSVVWSDVRKIALSWGRGGHQVDVEVRKGRGIGDYGLDGRWGLDLKHLADLLNAAKVTWG